MTTITSIPNDLQPAGGDRAVRVIGPFQWMYGVVNRHWQNLVTAFVQVWANKGRSLLTTLGIIIAVTATITVVSMVQGFGNYITNMVRGFGTNVMFIFPFHPGGDEGAMMGRVTLDLEDVRAAGARCDKVRRISPLVFSMASVEYARNRLDRMELQGVNEQFPTIRNWYAGTGRFFTPIEVENAAYVCVLGREMLDLLEADDRIVGDYVYINGVRFLVTGVLEAKGAVFGDAQDRLVVMPYTTAVKMFPFMARFMGFMAEATSEEDSEEAALQISHVLRERHQIQPGRPNDFQVFRQDELLRFFDQVKLIGTSVLTGIVGISLLVGGIGIMNVMLVSVTERTREIGLRKSVGGRRRDILLQFLIEAVVLATVGGAIGVTLGYSICAVASQHPLMPPVSVPLWSVALALTFSAGVGVVFGIIPAFKAAIIHPIDALRHE